MPLFHLFISSLRVGAGAPALRTQALDWDSDSQEEENIVVAETQPFVPQTRACRGSRSEGHIREATQTSGLDSAEDEISKQACMEESFQLGLSESSHIQDPVAAADMESTQAFVSVEANQLYASMNASEPDAAQADGDQEEEPATASALPGREGWENLALEATQAYLSDPYHESEEETDDEEKRSITADETQPFYGPGSATLAMAETQPMCVFEEEEDMKLPVPTAVQVKVRDQNEPEERAERSEAAVAQRRPLKEDLSLAETQPMCTRHDSESDDEDSFPGLRKRKTKQILQIEDEQTQPLTSSEQSTVGTQPLQTGDQDLAPGGSEAFHQDNPVAAQRRGAAALISSDLSTAATQLMTTGDDEESDEADAVLPRREAKPPQHREDEPQAAVCEPSLFKSQPGISGENDDGVDSLPGTERTKKQPSQILEERLQLLTNSTSSTHETGVLETKEEAGTSGSKVNGRRGTRATSRKVSTQCDEASRRTTRGLKDRSAAARRGTSKSGGEKKDELEDKEEEHTNDSGGIQSRNDVDVFNKTEQDVSQVQKQEEPSLGGGTELRQQENMEKETEEGEENERIETELSNRLEWERAEREKIERKEKEQWERAGRIQKDTEQLEREKKDLEDKERLERDKAEREEKERLEREKNVLMANEQTEQEEKEMLESERRKHDENLGREDQQREAKEVDGREDQLTEEKTVKKQEQKAEKKAKVSARGRRAAQRTPVRDTSVSANDDVPARRTRSRSNSSNSVSSERSALSVNLQESRGRGARRTSDPPPRVVASRSSTRRKTVAAHPTHGHSNDDTGRTGGRLRSDSSNSSFNQSPQGQGRGGRQRTRGGKAEAVSPAVSQGNPKPVSRGRKNTRAQSSSEAEKAGSQKATTSRGQRRSSSNGSGPTEARGSSNQGELIGNEESLQSKKNVRGRSHKATKREAVVAPQSPAVSSPGETKELRKGRKRGAEANTDMDSDRSSKFIKGGEMEETPGEAEEAPKQAQDEIPAPAKRRSRASVAQAKKPLTPSGPELKEANERIVEKRGRGRLAAGQKQKGEEQEGAEVSAEQRARVLEPEVT